MRKYEFRRADGRICCSSDDPEYLCASCRARAGTIEAQYAEVRATLAGGSTGRPNHSPRGTVQPRRVPATVAAPSSSAARPLNRNGVPDPPDFQQAMREAVAVRASER